MMAFAGAQRALCPYQFDPRIHLISYYSAEVYSRPTPTVTRSDLAACSHAHRSRSQARSVPCLLLIFLDHIPSNIVSWITLRNYGLSDATEIFIFISGYANAYVYGAVIGRRGLIEATAWILNHA